MFRFRRVVGVALEDFGLRRTVEEPTAGAAAATGLSPAAATGLPPGVVFHGSARRRPELQRFCEHLELLRSDSGAAGAVARARVPQPA